MHEQGRLGGCWSGAFSNKAILQCYPRGSAVEHINHICELDLPVYLHQEKSFYAGSEDLFESAAQTLNVDAFVPNADDTI